MNVFDVVAYWQSDMLGCIAGLLVLFGLFLLLLKSWHLWDNFLKE